MKDIIKIFNKEKFNESVKISNINITNLIHQVKVDKIKPYIKSN